MCADLLEPLREDRRCLAIGSNDRISRTSHPCDFVSHSLHPQYFCQVPQYARITLSPRSRRKTRASKIRFHFLKATNMEHESSVAKALMRSDTYANEVVNRKCLSPA